MEYTEIIPGLWLGNLRTALSKDFILDKRITCIINCTDSCPFIDMDEVKGTRIKKIRFPIKDNGTETEIQKMYAILDYGATVIYNTLQSNHILVHCLAGRQRSVSIILAFLMKYAGLTLQEAIDTVRSKKKNIGINFSRALVQYLLDLWAYNKEK